MNPNVVVGIAMILIGVNFSIFGYGMMKIRDVLPTAATALAAVPGAEGVTASLESFQPVVFPITLLFFATGLFSFISGIILLFYKE